VQPLPASDVDVAVSIRSECSRICWTADPNFALPVAIRVETECHNFRAVVRAGIRSPGDNDAVFSPAASHIYDCGDDAGGIVRTKSIQVIAGPFGASRLDDKAVVQDSRRRVLDDNDVPIQTPGTLRPRVADDIDVVVAICDHGNGHVIEAVGTVVTESPLLDSLRGVLDRPDIHSIRGARRPSCHIDIAPAVRHGGHGAVYAVSTESSRCSSGTVYLKQAEHQRDKHKQPME